MTKEGIEKQNPGMFLKLGLTSAKIVVYRPRTLFATFVTVVFSTEIKKNILQKK